MPWPEDTGTGYTVTLPDGSQLSINPATGEITQIPAGSPQIVPNQTPGTIADNTPFITPAQVSGSSSGSGFPNLVGGTQAFLPAAMKWLGALFLLWVVLTALSEHGDPNAHRIGTALAGLILFGALYALGPGALSNVRNLWTQTGTSAPVQGPNPVPGA